MRYISLIIVIVGINGVDLLYDVYVFAGTRNEKKKGQTREVRGCAEGLPFFHKMDTKVTHTCLYVRL